MAREGLTGSRIRERRVIVGLKQADLARQIGISASYLNLIEHNRRRIGGKLLLNIASALDVEPGALTEGAEVTLVAALRDAAQATSMGTTEASRVEEFAGRFPGWADALVTAQRRVAGLERTIETLTDRLAQDPQLAASVHEVLSTAAAIRATASILAGEEDIEPDWQRRFHANIDADSARLAESSKALAKYLDAAVGDVEAASSPQEEVEAFLNHHDHGFNDLELGADAVDDLVEAGPHLRSVASRHIARGVLRQVAEDAARLSLPELESALGDIGPDPLALARRFQIDLPLILRRMAALPRLDAGLVVADGAGSLLFRKPAPGFAIPRFGSACPLWPLFSALSVPGQVIEERVVHLGRTAAEFLCFAIAELRPPDSYNMPPLARSTMLVLPQMQGQSDGGRQARPVGSTCRVCPKGNCSGRREPSILSEGF